MAEYKVDRKIPGKIGWSTSTHGFPDWVEINASGLKGAPDVDVRVEIRDGVPEVVEFRIVAKPSGRAVRTSDLNSWQPLEGLALNEMRRAALGSDRGLFARGPADEREFWKIGGDLQRAQHNRKGPARAELEDVARIYRAAFEGKPTEAVQVQLNYSRRTAARRVQQARDVGLLPPTTPGRKNA